MANSLGGTTCAVIFNFSLHCHLYVTWTKNLNKEFLAWGESTLNSNHLVIRRISSTSQFILHVPSENTSEVGSAFAILSINSTFIWSTDRKSTGSQCLKGERIALDLCTGVNFNNLIIHAFSAQMQFHRIHIGITLSVVISEMLKLYCLEISLRCSNLI